MKRGDHPTDSTRYPSLFIKAPEKSPVTDLRLVSSGINETCLGSCHLELSHLPCLTLMKRFAEHVCITEVVLGCPKEHPDICVSPRLTLGNTPNDRYLYSFAFLLHISAPFPGTSIFSPGSVGSGP